ncbi:MAG: ATP-NAD kinase family protein [Candidatus Thermoplasmatota archaeon]|nr:ATP-NAD kinase family protein [Candidatus Thermoplasmatota archaeon]
MKKIGFIINPIAGMGGAVGLKGTDGRALEQALKLGAKPIALARAENALANLVDYRAEVEFYTCSGEMGSQLLKKFGFRHYIIYNPEKVTTARDTKKACQALVAEEVDLVLFCGGDGTARDIYEIVNKKVPILGIPAGVKMHSALFGTSPKATAELVAEFLTNPLPNREVEVMDTDEEKYRENILATKIFGYAVTIYRPLLLQLGKGIFESANEELAKEDIAKYIAELLEKDRLYILGAGTTIQKITETLGLEKTLLGIDVLKNNCLVAKDVNEEKLLKILEREKKVSIIISPIGAQGFILGRGNQQISAEVIKKVGLENIIVVATPHKLAQTPYLLVDTGDEELNKAFAGYSKIITGYHEMQMKKIIVP